MENSARGMLVARSTARCVPKCLVATICNNLQHKSKDVLESARVKASAFSFFETGVNFFSDSST